MASSFCDVSPVSWRRRFTVALAFAIQKNNESRKSRRMTMSKTKGPSRNKASEKDEKKKRLGHRKWEKNSSSLVEDGNDKDDIHGDSDENDTDTNDKD